MKAIATLTILFLVTSSLITFAVPIWEVSSRSFWEPLPFVRGDVSGDTRINIADMIVLLEYLAGGNGDRLDENCLGPADFNDDNKVDIADIVCIMDYLFTQGQPPEAPYPDEGYDIRTDTKGEMVGLGCWRLNEEL